MPGSGGDTRPSPEPATLAEATAVPGPGPEALPAIPEQLRRRLVADNRARRAAVLWGTHVLALLDNRERTGQSFNMAGVSRHAGKEDVTFTHWLTGKGGAAQKVSLQEFAAFAQSYRSVISGTSPVETLAALVLTQGKRPEAPGEFTAPEEPVEAAEVTAEPAEDIPAESLDGATVSPETFDENTPEAAVVVQMDKKEASEDDRINRLMGRILNTSKIPAYVRQAMRGFPIGVLEVLYHQANLTLDHKIKSFYELQLLYAQMEQASQELDGISLQERLEVLSPAEFAQTVSALMAGRSLQPALPAIESPGLAQQAYDAPLHQKWATLVARDKVHRGDDLYKQAIEQWSKGKRAAYTLRRASAARRNYQEALRLARDAHDLYTQAYAESDLHHDDEITAKSLIRVKRIESRFLPKLELLVDSLDGLLVIDTDLAYLDDSQKKDYDADKQASLDEMGLTKGLASNERMHALVEVISQRKEWLELVRWLGEPGTAISPLFAQDVLKLVNAALDDPWLLANKGEQVLGLAERLASEPTPALWFYNQLILQSKRGGQWFGQMPHDDAGRWFERLYELSKKISVHPGPDAVARDARRLRQQANQEFSDDTLDATFSHLLDARNQANEAENGYRLTALEVWHRGNKIMLSSLKDMILAMQVLSEEITQELDVVAERWIASLTKEVDPSQSAEDIAQAILAKYPQLGLWRDSLEQNAEASLAALPGQVAAMEATLRGRQRHAQAEELVRRINEHLESMDLEPIKSFGELRLQAQSSAFQMNFRTSLVELADQIDATKDSDRKRALAALEVIRTDPQAHSLSELVLKDLKGHLALEDQTSGGLLEPTFQGIDHLLQEFKFPQDWELNPKNIEHWFEAKARDKVRVRNDLLRLRRSFGAYKQSRIRNKKQRNGKGTGHGGNGSAHFIGAQRFKDKPLLNAIVRWFWMLTGVTPLHEGAHIAGAELAGDPWQASAKEIFYEGTVHGVRDWRLLLGAIGNLLMIPMVMLIFGIHFDLNLYHLSIHWSSVVISYLAAIHVMAGLMEIFSSEGDFARYAVPVLQEAGITKPVRSGGLAVVFAVLLEWNILFGLGPWFAAILRMPIPQGIFTSWATPLLYGLAYWGLRGAEAAVFPERTGWNTRVTVWEIVGIMVAAAGLTSAFAAELEKRFFSSNETVVPVDPRMLADGFKIDVTVNSPGDLSIDLMVTQKSQAVKGMGGVQFSTSVEQHLGDWDIGAVGGIIRIPPIPVDADSSDAKLIVHYGAVLGGGNRSLQLRFSTDAEQQTRPPLIGQHHQNLRQFPITAAA